MITQQQHVINDLRFELRFSSKQAAFAQQSDIIEFIKTELLPVADQLFDGLTPNDQAIRFYKLEIDLGQISYDSMRPDMTEQFRNELRKILIDSLKNQQPERAPADDNTPEQRGAASRNGLEQNQPTQTPAVQRLSLAESDLQIVLHFLSSGLLPWHATLRDAAQFDVLLTRVLDTNAADLIAFLHAGSPTALDRLIAQLPQPGLNILLAALVRGRRKNLHDLALIVDRLMRPAATAAGIRQRIWMPAIKQLLRLPAATLRIDHAIAAVRTALAAEGIGEPELDLHFQDSMPAESQWQRGTLVSDADRRADEMATDVVDWAIGRLNDGGISELKIHWPALTGPHRRQFETALRRVLHRERTRRTLISALDDHHLADLVTVLAPDATAWIARITAAPQTLFAAPTLPKEPHHSLRIRVWDYSIAYLVAERGSRFNQLSYLEYLLRRMAAHDNLDYATVLRSVADSLAQSTTPAGLPAELGALVSVLTDRQADVHGELRHDPHGKPQQDSYPELHRDARSKLPHDTPGERQNDAMQVATAENDGVTVRQPVQTPDVETLITLLSQSRFDELKKRWPALTGPQRPAFRVALCRTLHRKRPRHSLVLAMSNEGLIDIVTVLAPDAARWMVRIMPALQTFRVETPVAPEPVSRTRARLWDYSIAYLVVDRGSQFNKLSYMESLLRQMAAHDNLHYMAVLEAFAAILGQSVPRGMKLELTELVSELAQRETRLRRRSGLQDEKQLRKTLGGIDILRDLAAGVAASLTQAQLIELLEQLVADQPSYLHRLLRELRIDLDLDDKTITAGAILGELEKFASAQYGLSPADAGQREQHGAAELTDGRLPATPLKDDHDSTASTQRALAADAKIPGEKKQAVSKDDQDFDGSTPPALANESEIPGEKIHAVSTPEKWVTSESVDADSATQTAVTGDPALLHALAVLRQSLWRWPEYVRALLWAGGDLRHGAGSEGAVLRSALDDFLVALSAHQRLSPDYLAALVGQLTRSSKRTGRFWRHKLIEFAQRYDDPHYPQTDAFAALRLQSMLSPAPETTAVRHYASVVDHFEQLLRRTMTQTDPAALHDLRALFENGRDVRYLVNSLSEKSLANALAQLLPRDYTEIRYLTEVMVAAALFQQSYLTARALRRLIWHGVFDWLLGQGQPFAHASLARYLAPRLLDVMRAEDAAEFSSRLRTRLPRSARQQDWLPDLIAEPAHLSGEVQEPEQPEPEETSEEAQVPDQIFIENAGIVLLAPYLPRLFEMLGLTDNNEFIDFTAAEHAAHLLQFIVTDDTDAPEFGLALNKLLCGIPLGRPLTRQFEVSDAERDAVKGMLDAVIENWGTLGHTSRDGLKTSFLRREGRLHRGENGWQLLVQERAFDLLLDSLPWSYKLIKYAWMDEVIHVDWR